MAKKKLLDNRSAETTLQILDELGIEWHWNNRSNKREYKILDIDREHIHPLHRPHKDYPRDKWILADERIEGQIQEYAETNYQYKIGKRKMDMVLDGAPWKRIQNVLDANHQSDPYKDWVFACRRKYQHLCNGYDGTWEGPKLASRFPIILLGAPDEPLTEALAFTLTGGSAQRALAPGYKLDVCPVFIGEMGKSKSSVMYYMLPVDYRDVWFSDDISLNDDRKAVIESINGRVYVELSEMQGGTRAEREKVKALMSRRQDAGRLAYRKYEANYPRMHVFFGTSNDDRCVPYDPTGTRRWGPMRCEGTGMTTEDIEQWFDGAEDPKTYGDNVRRELIVAEAMARIACGEKVYIHGEVEKLLIARADRFMVGRGGVAEATIRSLPQKRAPLTYLMHRAGIDKKDWKKEEKWFAAALRAEGWYYGKEDRWETEDTTYPYFDREIKCHIWEPPTPF